MVVLVEEQAIRLKDEFFRWPCRRAGNHQQYVGKPLIEGRFHATANLELSCADDLQEKFPKVIEVDQCLGTFVMTVNTTQVAAVVGIEPDNHIPRGRTI